MWIEWIENQQPQRAFWRSENGSPAPKRIQLADDSTKADVAYRLVCEGTGLLWRGDFHNARQLLQALMRRVERKPCLVAVDPAEAFHLHRKYQAQRARILGLLLLPLTADYQIPLRRAPDVVAACQLAYGAPTTEASLVSLREIQSLIGAYEWHKKGVFIPALNDTIHPDYGVFSPVRGEYLELVQQAPLPATTLAFDIGTGTGVLAAILAKRGVQRVLATDMSSRALTCAQHNVQRLGVLSQVELLQTDLFPEGQAPLIVCNPPWIPARPAAPIEQAIFDQDSRMLQGFLAGVAAHLTPQGEAWLILSDIAEHLGLRTCQELMGWIAQGGLSVLARHETRPQHGKVQDKSDPLHQARSREITSLWRLKVG